VLERLIAVIIADVVAAADTAGPRYRYRGQHVIQSLLMNSDSEDDNGTDSDSDVSDVDTINSTSR